MNTLPTSTSTPASEVSSKAFYESEGRDDSVNSAELEAKLLGDILKRSPAAELIGTASDESLPQEDDAVPTPEDAENEEESAESADAENDLDESESEESEEEQASEEDEQDSTQDADLPTEEDIDWEYKVPVTIDGKTEYLTLEEIRKGYATDKHLSQKGREIGEQRKALEEERSQKLKELVDLGTLFYTELTSEEKKLESEYADIDAQIKKAKEDGDTYTARELKDKKEEIQEKYWSIRNKREENLAKVAKQFEEQENKQKETYLQEFVEKIPTYIPDWNEKTATSIREFAIQEGIPEGLLENVYSPEVVKFINDYRVLKQSVSKGQAKRKDVPTKKSVPVKKGASQAARKEQEVKGVRNKVFSGQATNQDQLDFLKQISSVSKKL